MSAALTHLLSRLPLERRAALLNRDTHAQGLTQLIGDALHDQDAEAAFALADRRCRIMPLPHARDHLLRAEAARRIGDRATAEASIRAALERDPTDVAVNLGVIAILGAEEARRAAVTIVATPTAEPEALRTALAVLVGNGDAIIANLADREPHLVGWVTWPENATLIGRVRGARSESVIEIRPDRSHPLACAMRRAAQVAFTRPDTGPVSVEFACGSQETPAIFGFSPLACWQPVSARGAGISVARNDLTVIVPVYEDYEATLACLDSLAAQQLPGIRWSTIVVDDHSPNRRLVVDLQRRAARGEIQLLSQPVNRGFSAAVNAAADLVSAGDILLLNADTLLPPDALRRLLTAARGPQIGTVMPLSNNGELASFPQPNVFNDLPSVEELTAWDRAAAAHAGGVIDIPNGVGFCLLVRRTCWDAVGGLSHAFGRGYYEDVDLCLRARELGFRNVCATNVIIGHAGSRSFRESKRALVVRNRATLEIRHPEYRADYAAFLHAAPLGGTLGRIERSLKPPPHPILLVTARASDHPTLLERQAELEAAGLHHLTAYRAGSNLRLKSGTGGVPQSIAFDLAEPRERTSLNAYLGGACVERVELLEPELCDDRLLAPISALDRPVDLHLHGADALQAILARPRLLTWAGDDSRILCRDRMALAAASGHLPGERLVAPVAPADPVSDLHPPRRADILAVLSPVACAASWRLIASLAGRASPNLNIRVLGATLDDLALMARGPVFISGAIAWSDVPAALARLAPSALVLPYRSGMFRCYEFAAAAGVAGAYFDWSRGRYAPRPGDLALDPGLCDEAAGERILDWFADARGRAPAANQL